MAASLGFVRSYDIRCVVPDDPREVAVPVTAAFSRPHRAPSLDPFRVLSLFFARLTSKEPAQ